MSIILDTTFSIYLALKINSERTYILCIILIILLLIALYWIFTIIEKYYFLNRLRLLQFNCWFITCHISTFSYFIVKFIIIFVYLPESMDNEDNFLISLIYFSIIWGLLSLPMLFYVGFIPCLLHSILFILIFGFLLIIFPFLCCLAHGQLINY